MSPPPPAAGVTYTNSYLKNVQITFLLHGSVVGLFDPVTQRKLMGPFRVTFT